eukprot:11487383-Ditylum_brightwellii.AAC.1
MATQKWNGLFDTTTQRIVSAAPASKTAKDSKLNNEIISALDNVTRRIMNCRADLFNKGIELLW